MKIRIIWKIDDGQLAAAMRKISESEMPHEEGVQRFIWWVVKYVYTKEDNEKAAAAWQMMAALTGEQSKIYAAFFDDKSRMDSAILGLPYELVVPKDVISESRVTCKAYGNDIQLAIKEWLSDEFGHTCERIHILKE